MEQKKRFIKKAIPVQVEFASASGCVSTLEGAIPYEKGDALLTGTDGERWPIRWVKFEQTYEAIHPSVMGLDGQYVKKPIPVQARQMNVPFEVNLASGNAQLSGQPGDWLVTAPDGAQWVVAGEIFQKTYIPLA